MAVTSNVLSSTLDLNDPSVNSQMVLFKNPVDDWNYLKKRFLNQHKLKMIQVSKKVLSTWEIIFSVS